MKRWVVCAALGLAALGGIVAPGTAGASSAAWYQVYQARVSGHDVLPAGCQSGDRQLFNPEANDLPVRPLVAWLPVLP